MNPWRAISRTAWLPVSWCALVLALHWMLPATPSRQFDLWSAGCSADVDDRLRWDAKLQAVVLGISSDGLTVCTADRADPSGWVYVGPVRVWNVVAGTLRHEFGKKNCSFGRHALESTRSLLHGDWLAVRYTIPSPIKFDWRSTCYHTECIHLPTGQTFGLDGHEFAVSTNHRWLAFDTGRMLQSPAPKHNRWMRFHDGRTEVRELETGNSRIVDVRSRQYCEPGSDGPARAEAACISDDGQFLLVPDRACVHVFDVQHNFLASLRIDGKSDKGRFFFSPDSALLAWETKGDTIATDLCDARRVVISGTEPIGWQPSGGLLLARAKADQSSGWSRGPISAVETWDWQKRCCTAAWEVPARPLGRELWRFQGHGEHEPNWVVSSRCGRHVAFARLTHEPPSKVSEWLTKWFGFPPPATDYVEVYLLDGSSLSVQETWTMPLQVWRDRREDYWFAFTDDGEHLVFTDSNVVEHWPLRPRSWLKSGLSATGVTLVLAGLSIGWRWWRGRTRHINVHHSPKQQP